MFTELVYMPKIQMSNNKPRNRAQHDQGSLVLKVFQSLEFDLTDDEAIHIGYA